MALQTAQGCQGKRSKGAKWVSVGKEGLDVSGYMYCLLPSQEHKKAFQEMWLGFLKHKVESGGWKCLVW